MRRSKGVEVRYNVNKIAKNVLKTSAKMSWKDWSFVVEDMIGTSSKRYTLGWVLLAGFKDAADFERNFRESFPEYRGKRVDIDLSFEFEPGLPESIYEEYDLNTDRGLKAFLELGRGLREIPEAGVTVALENGVQANQIVDAYRGAYNSVDYLCEYGDDNVLYVFEV